MTTPHLRIQDAAKALQRSRKSIRQYIHAGELKSTKVGGVYQIHPNDLNQFIDKFYLKTAVSNKKAAGHRLSAKSDEVEWVDISGAWESPSVSGLTSADLFCGAGGMALGFEMAGYRPVCGLDWMKEAGLTYRNNFKHPFIEGDIRSKRIKKAFVDTVQKELGGEELTVLSGGFPCQGFSLSGSRVVEDPRNSLYKDMLQIIKQLQPQFIVAENVKGLRSMLNGAVEAKITKDIQRLGYKVNVTVLNAADYYVPQKRERVIFIANRVGRTNYHPKPLLQKDAYRTTREAIEDLMDLPDDVAFNHVRTKHRPDMCTRLAAVPEGKSLYENYSDSWKKCPWNKASCTIKENHGGVNIHPKRPRVITVREMARLQSFPDEHIFYGSKAKQMVQIGNAVPPLLAKAIGLGIRESIEGVG